MTVNPNGALITMSDEYRELTGELAFLYSSGVDNSDRGRKFVFSDRTLWSRTAAEAHMEKLLDKARAAANT